MHVYKYMCTSVYVHKCKKGRVLTYLEKYLTPRARVCTCAAKELVVDYRMKEGGVMMVFRERKYKEERNLEREN